jgi:hypothetical protein
MQTVGLPTNFTIETAGVGEARKPRWSKTGKGKGHNVAFVLRLRRA